MSEGIWTMTESEFKQELANAWDEGFRDGLRQDAEGVDGPRFENPYRSAP